MFADLHTHTSLCKHADGTPGEYFENACKRGLSYLGVSDHIPWPAGYDTSSRMNPEQYSEYRSIVRRLRESACSTGLNWTGFRGAWTRFHGKFRKNLSII